MVKPLIQFHGGDEHSGGIFAVETIAPSDYLLESHRHEHAHLSILAMGVADVTVDGKTERLTGPCVVQIPADTVHSVQAVTEIAWYCLWADDIAPKGQAEASLKLVAA